MFGPSGVLRGRVGDEARGLRGPELLAQGLQRQHDATDQLRLLATAASPRPSRNYKTLVVNLFVIVL